MKMIVKAIRDLPGRRDGLCKKTPAFELFFVVSLAIFGFFAHNDGIEINC